jgi:type VI secretion system protein ImpM
MERSTLPCTPGAAPVQSATTPDFAWFGKLPSAGDFVSRRMPYALQQFWDRWCAGGMELLKAGNQAVGWELWRNTPKWAFLLPAQPGVPVGQLGVLAPSCDRVGRNFPLLVSSALAVEHISVLLPRVAPLVLAWSDVIAQVQVARQSVDVLDGRLEAALVNVLAAQPVAADAEATLPRGMSPATLPWPDLATTFDVQGSESYWWSVPPASTGFRARTHVGGLNAMHFLGLCS